MDGGRATKRSSIRAVAVAKLPGGTNKLENSVPFRFFCLISSDFVAGRSGFLVTYGTDFGWMGFFLTDC